MGLAPDTYVYLGGQIGSGFICIDTAQNVIDEVEQLSNHDKKLIRRSISNRKSLLKIDNENLEHLYDCRSKTDRTDDIDKMIKAAHEKLERDKIALAKFDEYLNTFVPFAEREVVEIYDRKYVSPYGKCILLEGFVSGIGYWFLSEYEQTKKVCK